LYNELKHLLPSAIKNAKTLLNSHNIRVALQEKKFRQRYLELDFANTKPFTSVHDLVETLNEELKKTGQNGVGPPLPS
jgi:hypothetical protein